MLTQEQAEWLKRRFGDDVGSMTLGEVTAALRDDMAAATAEHDQEVAEHHEVQRFGRAVLDAMERTGAEFAEEVVDEVARELYGGHTPLTRRWIEQVETVARVIGRDEARRARGGRSLHGWDVPGSAGVVKYPAKTHFEGVAAPPTILGTATPAGLIVLDFGDGVPYLADVGAEDPKPRARLVFRLPGLLCRGVRRSWQPGTPPPGERAWALSRLRGGTARAAAAPTRRKLRARVRTRRRPAAAALFALPLWMPTHPARRAAGPALCWHVPSGHF